MNLYKLVCYFVATIFCIGSANAESDSSTKNLVKSESCDANLKHCDASTDNSEEAVFSIFNKPSAEESKSTPVGSKPIDK